jgi:hypothetical protein
MGVIIGVVVGCAPGTPAGDEGGAEFKDASKVISTSENVRDPVSAGLSVCRGLPARGAELLAAGLGGSERGAKLRRAA